MDDRTGRLVTADEVRSMDADEQRHYIPVKRELQAKERLEMQIRLYSPCGCGSGKKFKFCHYRKP